MKTRRVVVTGMGALTPIGNNLNDYWTALKNGVSGAAPITYFNAEKFKNLKVQKTKMVRQFVFDFFI